MDCQGFASQAKATRSESCQSIDRLPKPDVWSYMSDPLMWQMWDKEAREQGAGF